MEEPDSGWFAFVLSHPSSERRQWVGHSELHLPWVKEAGGGLIRSPEPGTFWAHVSVRDGDGDSHQGKAEAFPLVVAAAKGSHALNPQLVKRHGRLGGRSLTGTGT